MSRGHKGNMTSKMTKKDKQKRDERNQRRGRDPRREAFRKNKEVPGGTP